MKASCGCYIRRATDLMPYSWEADEFDLDEGRFKTVLYTDVICKDCAGKRLMASNPNAS